MFWVQADAVTTSQRGLTMLNTAHVDIPAPVEMRLKRSSDFVDNIMEFAREDLIGFRRPLAATFAVTAPFVIAFVYSAAGFVPMVKIAASYFAVAALGLYWVGRAQWPALVEEFEARTVEKRKATADLKCGFSESSFLKLERAPHFIEHEHGVLIFADIGDFKTLFFSIMNEDADPRWDQYQNGEFSRRVWRWMRLPVSRELVKFSAEGSKVAVAKAANKVGSIDAWEAIDVALGEPLDGAIIHRPFDELVETVERLIV